MGIFLPFNNNPYTSRSEEDFPSFELLAQRTNLKARLSGAGEGGVFYRDFVPFTIKELRQHVGLYIFHGLSPSPIFEKKFQPQVKDNLHGNDFVYSSFGPNAERRHHHFKAFFALKNPEIETPSRKRYPNWKVRPILQWINFINPLIWLLGIAFSIDEMTMRFKGKHQDKIIITYKTGSRMMLYVRMVSLSRSSCVTILRHQSI